MCQNIEWYNFKLVLDDNNTTYFIFKEKKEKFGSSLRFTLTFHL